MYVFIYLFIPRFLGECVITLCGTLGFRESCSEITVIVSSPSSQEIFHFY